jgi:membrane-bound lytic murein transglycosylase F
MISFPSRHSRRTVFAVLFLPMFLLWCGPGCSVPPSSLDRIREQGRIVMITQNSANTYYLYRGEAQGFEYELAREFAQFLDVDLEVITPGWIEMFDKLDRGEGDFIAAGVTILPSRQIRVDFSSPYLQVRQQVIVHRKNEGVSGIEDLKGRTVHVRAGTSYQNRIAALNEKGLDIDLVLIPDIPTELLIGQVARGEIEITVADSNIALLNRRYNPDIRIAFPISGEQSLGWAVRNGDLALRTAVNSFLDQARKDGTFQDIYDHYYDNRVILGPVDARAFAEKVRTRLPRYEETIRRQAELHGFDWRFIAAMIYQESHFNPRARSHTGVRGLMQITQATAREMGVDDRMNPDASIRGGIKYLAKLADRFEDIEDERVRLLFALAAYNVGYGHVRDAQEIAGGKGLDPHSWSDLKTVLPLLARPEYYRRARHGYARGTEPVRYVEHILTYYDILRHKNRDDADV